MKISLLGLSKNWPKQDPVGRRSPDVDQGLRSTALHSLRTASRFVTGGGLNLSQNSPNETLAEA